MEAQKIYLEKTFPVFRWLSLSRKKFVTCALKRSINMLSRANMDLLTNDHVIQRPHLTPCSSPVRLKLGTLSFTPNFTKQRFSDTQRIRSTHKITAIIHTLQIRRIIDIISFHLLR